MHCFHRPRPLVDKSYKMIDKISSSITNLDLRENKPWLNASKMCKVNKLQVSLCIFLLMSWKSFFPYIESTRSFNLSNYNSNGIGLYGLSLSRVVFFKRSKFTMRDLSIASGIEIVIGYCKCLVLKQAFNSSLSLIKASFYYISLHNVPFVPPYTSWFDGRSLFSNIFLPQRSFLGSFKKCWILCIDSAKVWETKKLMNSSNFGFPFLSILFIAMILITHAFIFSPMSYFSMSGESGRFITYDSFEVG